MHVNDQYYEKVNHITKHLTLAKQHSSSLVVLVHWQSSARYHKFRYHLLWYSVQNAVGSIQCGVGGTPK